MGCKGKVIALILVESMNRTSIPWIFAIRTDQVTDNKILWHYTTFETLTQILQSKSLLASDFEALNDRNEFRTGLSTLRKFYGEGSISTDRKTPELIAFEEGILMDLETRLNGQVVSFSCAKDSLSMWRGYGKLGNGGMPVAIGFNESDLSTLAKASGFEGPKDVAYESGPVPQLGNALLGAELNAKAHSEWVERLRKYIWFQKNWYFREEEESRMVCAGGFGSLDRRIGCFAEVGGEFRKKLLLSLHGDEIYKDLAYPLGIKCILAGPNVDVAKINRYLKGYFFMHRCDFPRLDKSNIPFV